MAKYNHQEIEKKWQDIWNRTGIYKTSDDPKRPKFYCLDMFPYPSGAGLHVGHPKGYIATDVFSRFKTHQGYKVLHPMGWDAFGLPAENYAIKNKVHPSIAVNENVKRFKEQLEVIGFNYDWGREINTTDPRFFKWTQWIFLKLFEKGLAYQSYEPINWCPSCQTGLSMEDLEDGKCERCGGDVEQKPMRQWVLKITDYADRLLEDLKLLDWEEQIIEQQRNWIGRSEGARIKFPLVISTDLPLSKAGAEKSSSENGGRSLDVARDNSNYIEVFTTRPDTLFGVTFMVLAPEHPLVTQLLEGKINNEKFKNLDDIKKYVDSAKKKTSLQRQQEKKKTGVFSGLYAINPVNGEKIPVWISDYVLMGYGTGAIMAVPAHDERDYEFAKKFGIPIKQVIIPCEDDPNNPPQEGFEMVDRPTVIVHLKDKATGKYALLNWHGTLEGISTAIMGGIEKGQTPEEAALAEISEEAALSGAKIVKKLNWITAATYCASHKKQNRKAIAYGFLAEINNLSKQGTIEEKELENHSLIWVDKEDVLNHLTPIHQKLVWTQLNQESAIDGRGNLVNSGEFDGLSSEEAKEVIIAKLAKEGRAEKAISYKMKDWVFSRQRYWGEPIPIVHCEKCGPVAVPESELPLMLPDVDSYEPSGTGESPLANITDWVNTTCPNCGGPAKRETDTMPQWAGSSWYYLRYIDPDNDKVLIDPKLEKEWMPVDLYVGGIEHATRHLLYARFWHKFLYDIKAVSTVEPFKKLIHVGLILAEDGRKMSKRWNNVINPDDIVVEYGADALRVYEMFMGPFTQYIAWSTQGVKGARKFLEKVVNISEIKFAEISSTNTEVRINKLIDKVTSDIEGFRFNTAIAAFMEFVNYLNSDKETISKLDFEKFLILLNSFAPHLTEELWEKLGNTESIYLAPWPEADKSLLVEEVLTVAVQVNGKVRDTILVSFDAKEAEVLELAQKSEKVSKYISAGIKKSFYVSGKILSIVTN